MAILLAPRILSLTFLFACASAASQRHIIVIVADDLGFNDVSFHGSDLIPTPNIDALAYSGRILNRHYVLPICTPSRTALLTGTQPILLGTQGYPMKAGQRGGIPLSFPLLPENLKKLGYKTHLTGKWHVGFESSKMLPTERGFDSFLGYYSGYIDYFTHTINQTMPDNQTVFSGFDMHEGSRPRWDLQGQYATDLITERARSVIQDHDTADPLFLMITHVAAHTGEEETDGLQTPHGMDVDKEFPYIKGSERRNYAGLIKTLDDSVGEVVGALSEAGILKDSIILFIADNGAASVASDSQPNFGSNWPLRGVKFTLYEGGVRGTALLWGKGIQGSVVDQSIYHITDWKDLILQMAGGEVTDSYTKSLWNIMKNGPTNESTARDLLLNLDEKENAESVMLGSRWKVIKQNYREYGNYDFHYETQRNGDDVPKVSPEIIRNSKTGIALQELDVFPTDDTILHLRSTATEKCEAPNTQSMGKVAPSTSFLCQDFCVFDIIDDPCELTPLDNPAILERGKSLLDLYRKRLVPQNTNGVDPDSDPRKFGGVWTPWRDESWLTGKSNVLCVSLIFSLLIPFVVIKYFYVK